MKNARLRVGRLRNTAPAWIGFSWTRIRLKLAPGKSLHPDSSCRGPPCQRFSRPDPNLRGWPFGLPHLPPRPPCRTKGSERNQPLAATTEPSPFRAQHWGERSLLSPHSFPSLLAFLGGRAYSALPCAGAEPPQRPLSYNPRRSECVRNTTLTTRCGRASPRVLADSKYVPAQARQARQLPSIPKVHRYDHREPATEILTVRSAQTDRTQNSHTTWLSRYLLFPI